MATNYDYQETGIAFLSENRKAILGDDMGLGKSRQAILAADENCYERILIVTLPASKSNWITQISKWGILSSYVVIEGNSSQMKKKWDKVVTELPRYCITHYENFRKYFDIIIKQYKPDIIIFDEAHRLANRKSQIVKIAFKVSAATKCDIFFLTGTPARNGMEDLWTLLHMCNRKEFGSYWDWVKKYFVYELENYGGRFPVWKIKGIKDTEEFKNMLKPYFLRRLKSQVLDLHTPHFSTFYVDMYPDQKKHYATMLKQNYAEIIEGEETIAVIEISQILRLRQIANSPDIINPNLTTLRGAKYDGLLEILEGSSSKKKVIFSESSIVVERLISLLSEKYKTIGFSGKEKNSSRRYEISQEFQNNPDIEIFVTTYKTGGIAIDLFASSHAILFDRPWVPDDILQAVDRLNRIGQTEPVEVTSLEVRGSIEDYVWQVAAEKLKVNDDILNNVETPTYLMQRVLNDPTTTSEAIRLAKEVF